MVDFKLQQLSILIQVAQTGSFTAASIELGCTQSRISHAIGELERRIGARLLVRSKAGCALTAAGHRVVAKAHQLLRVAESISREARSGAAKAHVRVASIRSVSAHLLPYAVEALSEEMPWISIEILDGCGDYEDVVRMVLTGDADIGVTRVVNHDALLSIPYVYDPYVVVVPSGTETNPILKWSDLAHLPLIQIKQNGAAWILEQFRARGFTQLPAFRLTNESSILNMVGRGLGYTILPRLATMPDVAGTKILAPPCPTMRRLVLILRSETSQTTAAQNVMRFLRDPGVLTRSHAWRINAIGVDPN